MDFLVSQSSLPERVKNRYDETIFAEGFDVRYADSGNMQRFNRDGSCCGLASGCLFGALSDESLLGDANVASLGRAARASDGSFAVVVPRGEHVLLVTDAGGSIPVYYGRGPKGFAVGTLVHHVAAASGQMSLDYVSIADYLFHQTVCFPYSWYEGVRVAPPGSVCTFSSKDLDCHTYWQPSEPSDLYEPSDEREWGGRLRGQVHNSIRLSLSGSERARVMYSGGSDSRAVLSLVPDSFTCVPTTVLDGGPGHREYELARRSARALGRELEWIPRPEGYYRSDFRERIDTIGPGWDVRHTHIYGPVAEQFDDGDVMLGGYLADSLFKTHYMSNVEEEDGWGRSERLLEPTPDIVKSPNFQSRFAPLWSNLLSNVHWRRHSHHQKLKELRPQTAGNWHRIWPLSNLAGYPHYLTTMRTEAMVSEPFMWAQAYQLAARMPDTCRVNSSAFREAFAEEMGAAGYIVTSSGRVPRFSNGGITGALAETVAQYIRSWPTIKRGIKAIIDGGYGGPQGPWHPDSQGWQPVRPENHFSERGQELLFSRLCHIMADGQTARFFGSEKVSAPMQVRALALGFR